MVQKRNGQGITGICGRRSKAVLLAAMFLLAFCFGAVMSAWRAPATVYAAAPSVTVTKKTLYVGYENYQIKFKNLSTDAKVTYQSSNTKVAKVTSTGLIKPVAKGSATVTVKIVQKGKTYTKKIAVTVKNPSIAIPNKKASLVQSSDYLLVGKAYGLKNAKFSFSSSDVMVAKVDASTGMVHARSAGTAKITMKDNTSGKSVSFTLKVVAQDEGNAGQVYVSSSALGGGYSYTAPKDTSSLTKEEAARVAYLSDIQARITKGESITIDEMADYYLYKDTGVEE